MLHSSTTQNALPLIMQITKATALEISNEEYTYDDISQKPEYRLDYLVSRQTKVQGGWTWDTKTTKTPPKVKK